MNLTADRTTSIGALFENFFEVAEFQREYVWEDEDVKALLSDLYEAFVQKKTDYFIGSIVLSQKGSVYQIIDGQQRLTTVFILCIAMRDKMKSISSKQDDVTYLESKIRSLKMSDAGAESTFRLISSNDESNTVFSGLYYGDKPINVTDDSSTRIIEAYRISKAFFDEVLNDSETAIALLHFILSRISLLPYVAASEEQALIVFETLNNRGRGLTPIDLVKSRLFQNTPKDAWDKLQEDWKDFLSLLESTKDPHQRFLRYFILVNYGADVSDTESYKWIRKNDSTTKVSVDPDSFLTELFDFCKSYNNLINGLSPDGSKYPIFMNIKKLAGRARQHFPFILAAKKLSREAVEKIALASESVIMGFAIQRMYTGEIERVFKEWAIAVRCIETHADFDDFYDNRVVPYLHQIGESAYERLKTIELGSITKQKIQYLLARIDSYVQTIADQNSIYRDISDAYKGSDIEHIMPQTLQKGKYKYYNMDNESEYEKYKDSLGNLTLLERPLNRAIQNKDFIDKLKIGYEYSCYIITKGIC